MPASTVYSTDAKVGVYLQYVGTEKKFALLTNVEGNNNKHYVFAYAPSTLGSAANINIGSGGSATAASAGTYNVATAGGVAGGSYFWAQRNTN